MNKKFLMIFLVLGVPMVLAFTYFTLFTATFSDVQEAITGATMVDNFNETIFTGEWIPGSEGTIENHAPSEREITISNDKYRKKKKYRGSLKRKKSYLIMNG